LNKSNTIRYQKLSLDSSEIPYQARFSKKAKYLQIRITSRNQLELVIPKRYSLHQGEKFLLGKLDWIKKYRKKLLPVKDEFLLFGRPIRVVHTYDFFLNKHKVRLKDDILFVESPAGSKVSTSGIFNMYLKKTARFYLHQRVLKLADTYGFEVRKIGIRGQYTRWGSCSSKGNLSFNFKLLQFREEVIDYVITHELCHLKEMNHSKKFWMLVGKFCPDYKKLREELLI